jgi:hypothetical protein
LRKGIRYRPKRKMTSRPARKLPYPPARNCTTCRELCGDDDRPGSLGDQPVGRAKRTWFGRSSEVQARPTIYRYRTSLLARRQSGEVRLKQDHTSENSKQCLNIRVPADLSKSGYWKLQLVRSCPARKPYYPVFHLLT